MGRHRNRHAAALRRIAPIRRNAARLLSPNEKRLGRRPARRIGLHGQALSGLRADLGNLPRAETPAHRRGRQPDVLRLASCTVARAEDFRDAQPHVRPAGRHRLDGGRAPAAPLCDHDPRRRVRSARGVKNQFSKARHQGLGMGQAIWPVAAIAPAFC